MATPNIGILTPSYNYAHFIRDTIHSVEAQDGVNVQHVIADGASTDGTRGVLAEFDWLTWISEPDAGQSDALNRALALTGAPIVGWLNADEFYLPGALQRVLREFEATEVDVVYGDAVFVDPDGRMLRLVPQHPFSRLVLRHYGTYISSCAVFFRREFLGESPWDVAARRIMDWDLFLKLAASRVRFSYIPTPLGAFRVHDQRVTATKFVKGDPEAIRIRSRHGLPVDPKLRALSSMGGRGVHIALKLRHGSYARQYVAAQTRGTDLRWWAPHELPQAVSERLRLGDIRK